MINPTAKATGRRLIWRYWYPYLTRLIKDEPIIFLNYGYLDPILPRIPLQEADEPDRLFIQLYHHLAQAVDLTGQEVMEVSCGHGGGASYIKRYLGPKSMLGVDLNPQAIAFCHRHHQLKDLTFTRGNAESLWYEDQSFDVIFNLEASHCYGDMTRFLKEVTRLLRPGGYFLFADFRSHPDQALLRAQLEQSGLEIIKAENITPNVLNALELTSEERVALIRQFAPRLLQSWLKRFAAVKGSGIYKAFQSGEMVYWSYVLRREL
jgi:ubiquinone/menaquinone biosynthesis C-methylase UbiE